MRSFTRVALFTAAAALPAQVVAQGVTVQHVSDVHFQGALGTLVGIAAKMGGANTHNIVSTTYVSGHRMRTDNEESGTIIDLDAERITNIDNKAKTYSSMTFTELGDAMRQATSAMREDQAQARGTNGRAAPNTTGSSDSQDKMHVTYKVAVDRTGAHQKIAGYDAERVFITISLEGDTVRSDGKTDEVGTLVLLLDQWMSKGAPQIAAMAEFQRAYAQKLGKEFQSQARGLQSAFAADPRIKEGFDAAATEMKKVDGIPLRSTTYVVGVPAGVTFDRQMALGNATASAAKDDTAKKGDKPKSGFGGFLNAVKAAAENADKPAKSDSTPPRQGTLLVLTDEVKTITSGAVPDAMFAPPAAYREVAGMRR